MTTTAVDTSVLIGSIGVDQELADRCDIALQEAEDAGRIIVCDLVVAEFLGVVTRAGLETFMQDWSVSYEPSTFEVAERAGEQYRRYLQRGGKRGRIVADIVIGCHAELLADQLLTLDQGFRRDYFAALKVVSP